MRAIFSICCMFMIPFMMYGQHHSQGDHEHIESLFIGHITMELDLSPEESRKFWPIYNDYKNEYRSLKKSQHTSDAQAMTDAEAQQVLDKYLIDYQARVDLKKKFYSDLSEVISPLRVLKFKNAEHSFRKQMFDKMKENRGS